MVVALAVYHNAKNVYHPILHLAVYVPLITIYINQPVLQLVPMVHTLIYCCRIVVLVAVYVSLVKIVWVVVVALVGTTYTIHFVIIIAWVWTLCFIRIMVVVCFVNQSVLLVLLLLMNALLAQVHYTTTML